MSIVVAEVGAIVVCAIACGRKDDHSKHGFQTVLWTILEPMDGWN